MKKFTTHLIILTLALLCSICAYGQGKLYTKKARLEDFPTKTTKVVIEGTSFLGAALREEISTRWRISPYEFCNSSQYESLRDDNSLYFLNMAEDEGIAFLILSKGGKEDEVDNLKKPFEVIRMPIASIGDPTGKELMFMGAFIDIMQAFVEDAMLSDKAAYAGLKWYNTRKFNGKSIYVNNSEAIDSLYLEGAPEALLGITIAPTVISSKSKCYKMLVSADTHELYYFKSKRFTGSRDTEFTESEIKQFNRRNGDSSR